MLSNAVDQKYFATGKVPSRQYAADSKLVSDEAILASLKRSKRHFIKRQYCQCGGFQNYEFAIFHIHNQNSSLVERLKLDPQVVDFTKASPFFREADPKVAGHMAHFWTA